MISSSSVTLDGTSTTCNTPRIATLFMVLKSVMIGTNGSCVRRYFELVLLLVENLVRKVFDDLEVSLFWMQDYC